MYDDTFNRLGIQSFLNIFKSKPHTPLASAHAPMTHFELQSDFTGQFFGIL